MRNAFRFLGVLAAVVVGAIGGLVSPAQAASSDTIHAVGHVQVSPYPLIGGGGTFNVDQTIACVVTGVSGDGVDAGDPASVGCTIAATGSFTSIFCGTGSASGSYSATSGDGSIAGSFNLTVVAGQGTIIGTSNDDNGTLAGTVNLIPDPSPSPTTICTTGFRFVLNATNIDPNDP